MQQSSTWQLRTRTLCPSGRILLMGIVNVTPDSFSDGGLFTTTSAAVDHALRLLDDGADIVDIGGESTRPGAPAGTADALPAQEEQQRVVPVIEGILRARPNAVISVDTYRSATAHAGVQAGAEIVNDVSGLLWDPAMESTLASLKCGAVLMHTRGVPSAWATQQPLPPDEVTSSVLRDLQERLDTALVAGIAPERIVLDPGFGFGKRGEENWALLHALQALKALGRPVLVGLSRKRFLAPDRAAADRDAATHLANAVAVERGAALLRVHDVAGARTALKTASAP